MLKVFFILAPLLLVGCGGSSDSPAGGVSIPQANIREITNNTLNSAYNSLSIWYSATSTSSNEVVANDIVYENGVFKSGQKIDIGQNNLDLQSYAFNKEALGNFTAAVNGFAYSARTLATSYSGLLAAYSANLDNSNLEALSVQIKKGYEQASLSTEHMQYLSGDFGVVSMNLAGEIQAVESTFFVTSTTTGYSVNKGFSAISTTSSTSVTNFLDEGFSIDSGNFRMLNQSWPWFHTKDFLINMTGRTSGVLGNALTFLFKVDNNKPSGTYHIFQWTSLVAGASTVLDNKDVMRLGTFKFTDNTVSFNNILDIRDNNYQYSRVDTFNYMFQFEQISGINDEKHSIKFFIVKGGDYLFGVEHDSTGDNRVSLFIGIKDI